MIKEGDEVINCKDFTGRYGGDFVARGRVGTVLRVWEELEEAWVFFMPLDPETGYSVSDVIPFKDLIKKG